MENTMQDEINLMINQEIPKREIYDQLKEKYKDKLKLAKAIQATLTPNLKKKYKVLNNVLLSIWLVIAILDFIAKSYAGFAIDCLFIYFVMNFKTEYYVWIALRAFFSIMSGIFVFQTIAGNTIVLMLTIIIFIMIITSFILGIYLSNAVSPALKSKRIVYTDENGIQKYKNVYDFTE